MAAIERWTVEMQMVQESLVWLVPGAEMARTLVSEAGIPDTFIDFGEPVWNRIKRIMVEAEKREMIPALLAVITKWYPENIALAEAKLAWETGQDRRGAAMLLHKAAKSIPEPTATAKVTRREDVVTEVDVEVVIPEPESDAPEDISEATAGVPYSDELMPGDWFSMQKTLVDQEHRLAELELWRQQLSIMPTIQGKNKEP